MAVPDLHLATNNPDDPNRLIIVHMGPISIDHASQAALDFLESAQIIPVYTISTSDGRCTHCTFPIAYRSHGTTLFASIDAPTLEIASHWLDLLSSNCVMFNP